jgi:hypothetical protein
MATKKIKFFFVCCSIRISRKLLYLNAPKETYTISKRQRTALYEQIIFIDAFSKGMFIGHIILIIFHAVP